MNIYLDKVNRNDRCSICGKKALQQINFQQGKGILFVNLCEDHWNELKNIMKEGE